MKQYIDLVKDILANGNDRDDRTGTGTRGVFGRQLRFDLREGFPLVTTKKMFTRGIIVELLWFISGSTNVKDLQKQKVHIWDNWMKQDGSLGPVYGKQWRDCIGVADIMRGSNRIVHHDQLAEAIRTIIEHPESRRIIVNSWNVAQIDDMALPPCHCMYQFYVEGKYLDMQLYQRSCDVAIGLPFNIAQYAILQSLVARLTGKIARFFVHTFGDVHIYKNHLTAISEQIEREPYMLPYLIIEDRQQRSIDDFTANDIEISGYQCHPAIKFEVSV